MINASILRKSLEVMFFIKYPNEFISLLSFMFNSIPYQATRWAIFTLTLILVSDDDDDGFFED
jgi:hypothetical protein